VYWTEYAIGSVLYIFWFVVMLSNNIEGGWFLNVLKDVYGKWLYHKVNLLYRYTAGVVGGLSAVAVCAPSDRFLSIGGPLAIGLGVVFASSLGK